jgi:hypothetical protein
MSSHYFKVVDAPGHNSTFFFLTLTFERAGSTFRSRRRAARHSCILPVPTALHGFGPDLTGVGFGGAPSPNTFQLKRRKRSRAGQISELDVSAERPGRGAAVIQCRSGRPPASSSDADPPPPRCNLAGTDYVLYSNCSPQCFMGSVAKAGFGSTHGLSRWHFGTGSQRAPFQ